MEFEERYLNNIVGPLITTPDVMTIERIVDNRGVLLTLSVSAEDMGYVIGKGGETVLAMRKLLHQYGMCHEMRLSLRVNEPEGSKRFMPEIYERRS